MFAIILDQPALRGQKGMARIFCSFEPNYSEPHHYFNRLPEIWIIYEVEVRCVVLQVQTRVLSGEKTIWLTGNLHWDLSCSACIEGTKGHDTDMLPFQSI